MGLIGVAMSGILYAMGSYNISGGGSGSVIQGILNLVIIIGMPILAINKIKGLEGGYISFGQAFTAGFQVILISSIFVAVWIFIYGNYLNPDYQEPILQSNYEQLSKQDMSEADMDQSMEVIKWVTTPFFLGLINILTSAFFGAIVSLILAAILQKKDPSTI